MLFIGKPKGRSMMISNEPVVVTLTKHQQSGVCFEIKTATHCPRQSPIRAVLASDKPLPSFSVRM
jgi:hypothetical protein